MTIFSFSRRFLNAAGLEAVFYGEAGNEGGQPMVGEAILTETAGIVSKECVAKASVATERVSGELARSRDELLEEFVRQHARLIYRIAYAVLRSHPDAEDATQETFLRVLRYGHRLEAVENPKTWLARIAWRVAVDRSRKRGRRQEVEFDEEAPAEMSAETPAYEMLRSSQVSGWLEKLIAALPRKLRQPLILSTLEEMSPAEVAATLGISEAAVRSRVFRARRLLQERMTVQGSRR
ncbi:MAG: RNA polymerase sigma factor [Terriglobales bacterium]|jgi:RNA polymerase sigma-70 factor (ECF subfamily)